MSTDADDITIATTVAAPTARQRIEMRLAAYYDQEQKLMRQGQEYQLGDGPTARRKRNPELAIVQSMIATLEGNLAALDNASLGRPVIHVR